MNNEMLIATMSLLAELVDYNIYSLLPRITSLAKY